jgi:hypothetical protein
VTLCGGYPGYYYTYTAWDVIRPDDEPPGYRMHQWLVEFMRASEWWRLAPHPEMVMSQAAWCLARPGEAYVIGSAGRDDVRTILIGAAESGRRFACTWLHPLTGERAETVEELAPRRVLRPPWRTDESPAPFVVRLHPQEMRSE